MAAATASRAVGHAARTGATDRAPAASRPPTAPAAGVLRRCACGGSCPRCRASTLQPKLAINTPGDAHEREAERAAAAVMSASPAKVGASPAAPALRRCACGGGCPSCAAKKEEQEEELHREDAGGGGAPGFAPPVVHEVLASPGRALPGPTRSFMESRFGADFSGVRVHDDARAAESARAVDAHAYTAGSHVAFAARRYAPGTPAGDRLLAHELAHTLQQGGVARRLQRACGPAGIGTPAGCAPQPPEWISGYRSYAFDTNCDTLAAGAEADLLLHAPALPASIEVHGYASTSGDAVFNQHLSCARALTALRVLTDPAPAGAGIPHGRITGVFSHGATPGAEPERMSVVLSPPAPTPTPVPSPVPAAGPGDFLIERVGRSTRKRIYFGRGSAVLDLAGVVALVHIKILQSASVSLVGFASTDEPPSLAQDRANAVRAVLATLPYRVTVTSAVGNAQATEGRSDYTEVRSVEVVPVGAAPTTRDCSRPENPPTAPCASMDPATDSAFNEALVVANDAMTRAVASVAGTPSADDAAMIDRFFGNHNPATLTALRNNLPRLQAHVAGLPAITTCGGQCDKGFCDQTWTMAYNNGKVDGDSRLTICTPGFRNAHLNDRARNLIHESAHGTSPLGGAPGTGTKDLAYRYERMMFELSPADRLRNSDSYALFAMFLREPQVRQKAGAVPAGIDTPVTDVLLVPAADEPALRLAIARLEKRITWAKNWMAGLAADVHRVRTGADTWAAAAFEDVMREAAARFPLTPPTTPSTTTLDDETRVAAILERYRRMAPVVKRSLTVTPMPTGVVSWSSAPAAWEANRAFSVGPEFFLATPEHQVSLLLEALAAATRDVEAAYVPSYVSLAAWIHAQNP